MRGDRLRALDGAAVQQIGRDARISLGTKSRARGEGHPCPAIIVLDDGLEKYQERSTLVRSLSGDLSSLKEAIGLASR